MLEVHLEDQRRLLFFKGGDLFLPGVHPLARRAAELLADGSPIAEVELLSFLTRIATTLRTWRHGEARFLAGNEYLASGLVGPLPSLHLVMELAVIGRTSAELVAGLGGPGATLKATRVDQRLARIPLLDSEELELLERMRTPLPLETLLTEAGDDTYPLLCRLGRLQALRWISREREGAGAFSQEIVARFADRIARLLKDRPITLEPRAHREVLADLLARVGGTNHYELLSVPPGAALDQVHKAYEELGRLVHPLHAAPLGLEGGREAALEILFERATEGYFVLSDPKRRAAYDQSLGPLSGALRKPGERDEEKQALARQYYTRARSMLHTEEFHYVIDLMGEAVRYDPRPEYFALMGEALSKNPLWLARGADALQKAISMGSTDPRVRLRLAQLLEQLDRPERARSNYRWVVLRGPEPLRTEAVEGLERLGEKPPGAPKKPGLLRRLFGRG